MRIFIAIVVLMLKFSRAVLVSGVDTIRVIVRSSRAGANPPETRLVRLAFAPMSEPGAVLLGAMISLTPGTTTIDIDMDRHEFLLHVLDASDLDSIVEGVRQEFEPGLVLLFGQGRSS